MTMQRRNRQWVTTELGAVQQSDVNTPRVLAPDLLANLEGVEDYAGYTISRIIGSLSVISSSESSPSSVSGLVYAGFTIISERLAQAAPSDANLPDPTVSISAEGDWWWRWGSPRLFSDPNNQPASLPWPYFPTSASIIPIDISSQRKLRSGQRASLIVSQAGWASVHEPTWYGWLRCLVLLP